MIERKRILELKMMVENGENSLESLSMIYAIESYLFCEIYMKYYKRGVMPNLAPIQKMVHISFKPTHNLFNNERRIEGGGLGCIEMPTSSSKVRWL